MILAPLLVPVAALIQLLTIKKTADRTAEDVAGFLRDFINGTGGDWDWDDFTCVSITSPELEALRAQAALVDLPVTSAGLEKLRELLAQAEALSRSSN